jgi:hypothetical protein
VVGYDEEVDELGMTGHDDVKRKFFDVWNGGGDDGEKKRGF